MFKTVLALLFLSIFVACNSNEVKPVAVKPVDSAKIAATPATVTEEPFDTTDYVKRNINVDKTAWPAIALLAHITGPGKNSPSVTGNFRGDGKQLTLQLLPPVIDTTTKDAFQKCYGGTNSYLMASDSSMPLLKVHDNLGGDIKNIGDVDGDGADDLMVYPSWWQSSWNPYRLYSFDKATNKWVFLTDPISIFENELYNKRTFVKRSAKKGFVTAYTSESNDRGIRSWYKDFPVIKGMVAGSK